MSEMTAWRLPIALACFILGVRVVGAVSTSEVPVPPKIWTDLGAGPLVVEVVDPSRAVRFAISDVSPTAQQVGFISMRMFRTASHVWAYSQQGAAVTVAAIAPSVGGSAAGPGSSASPVPLASGIGGTYGDTVGLAVTTSFIPPSSTSPYKSITVTNQAPLTSNITMTVCLIGVKDKQGNTIMPATDARGCYTFGPKGHYSAPAGGYVPQDGLNALASAPNTPATVELH